MGWVKDKGSMPQFKEGGKIKKYQRGGQINPLVQPNTTEGYIPGGGVIKPTGGNIPQGMPSRPIGPINVGTWEEGGKVEKKKTAK